MTLDITATIEGTSALNEFYGGIWYLNASYNSHLDLTGGQVHQLTMNNDATAVLSGGLIQEMWSYQSAWKYDTSNPPALVPNPHIEIICRDYDDSNPNWITGTWNVDNDNDGLWDTFSIELLNQTGYSPVIDNIKFTIIPEPATLALFGLGGLLLRRKRS